MIRQDLRSTIEKTSRLAALGVFALVGCDREEPDPEALSFPLAQPAPLQPLVGVTSLHILL
jgi:hypothetical protein